MSTATLERLPNTVTACHAEIRKLRALASGVAAPAERAASLEIERNDLLATVGTMRLEAGNNATKIETLKEQVSALESERDELKDTLETMEREKGDAEERVEELEGEVESNADPINAIDQFLFEVQRPVGQFKFDVLHGAATDRAILRLYDAAGRQP